MRSDNISMLQDTLSILEKGSYQFHGAAIPLKLSRSQMEEVEVYLPKEYAQQVIDISKSFGIDAQIIGRIEVSDHTHLTIHSEYGTFEY